jgi:hypothetical protein
MRNRERADYCHFASFSPGVGLKNIRLPDSNAACANHVGAPIMLLDAMVGVGSVSRSALR